MLELPPHIEQVLIERAEQQGISVAQMLVQDYAPNAKVTDLFADTPTLPIFQGIDPVAYQRALRDD